MSKPKINPALIAALEHYAEGRFNQDQPHLYVHTDAHGHQSPWPLERACGIAAELLDTEELNFLKLMALKEGLLKFGMESVYERIMGEKLEQQR
jgi:hypothetical protein